VLYSEKISCSSGSAAIRSSSVGLVGFFVIACVVVNKPEYVVELLVHRHQTVHDAIEVALDRVEINAWTPSRPHAWMMPN
jgi:uncharacterized membrane protein